MTESVVSKDWQEGNSYAESLQHSRKKITVKPDVKICTQWLIKISLP